MRAAIESVLARPWERVRAGFDAERAWHLETLAGQSLRATLEGLAAGARWNGSALELDSADDVEVTLDEQGLMLLPSVFWTGHPLIGTYAHGAFLVYPALTPLPLLDDPGTGRSLAVPPGRTRAAVLEQLVRPRTGTDLGRELGLAKSSVSEHTKALRAARLITARRDGAVVRHSCTTWGEAPSDARGACPDRREPATRLGSSGGSSSWGRRGGPVRDAGNCAASHDAPAEGVLRFARPLGPGIGCGPSMADRAVPRASDGAARTAGHAPVPQNAVASLRPLTCWGR
ncbi:winged helix-turn-helix domain-containing protein [Streptomyces cinnamoneus]|uniref:ArsR/SmtB family transcription factor n=1 Tax=Streptomyces cinnamoneus TaxID=53446 RepID=UPI0033EABDD5